MKEINKNKILSSLLWKLMERTGSQGIQFIVQVVLARVLLPEDFGIIAIVSTFIILANVFIQSGFNIALIQKKEVDEIDYSSAFYLSLFITTVIYSLLYYTAPFIADFYELKILVPIFRILGLVLFLGCFNSIQNAMIAKEMQFKLQFISTFGAVAISGVLSILLALNGFGIWALVIQQLISQLFITIIYFKIVKWYPKLQFSFKRIKILFSFGWKVLLSNLLDTLFDNVRTLIIGKTYSPSLLGYYNRGRQVPSIVVDNLNGSIQAVMLPALSQNQSNRNGLKSMLRRSISMSSYLIFPIMIGIIVSSKALTIVLFTDKWIPVVPYLQMFAVTYLFRPIQMTNLQAIMAMGRSDISLKLQILKNIIGFLFLILTIKNGVLAIAFGGMLATVVSTFLNMYPNKKILDYSYKEQLSDILPSLIISILMGLPVYAINFFGLTSLITLLIQIFVGIIIYFILSIISKSTEFKYLKITIESYKKS